MSNFSKSNGNKKIVMILSVLLALCLMLACVSFIKTGDARAESAVIPQEVVADEYVIGTSVSFPSEIQVQYKGQNFTANKGYIVYPDGSAVYVGNLVLNQLGEYKVNYFFETEGRKIIAKKNFEVTDKLYTLSTDNGSIVAVTSTEQVGKTYTKSSDNILINNESGLIVRLADKNVFTYAKSIDLTNVGEDGLCDIISLDYNLSNFILNENPDKEWKQYYPGGETAKYCVIRLTDSYNESNFIELFLHADFPVVSGVDHSFNPEFDFLTSESQGCYRGIFTAAASGQKRTGMIPWGNRDDSAEWGGFKKINVGGNYYGTYIDNRFGNHSSLTLGQSFTTKRVPYTWAFDYKTGNVYLKAGERTSLVTALSNSDIYGTSVFKGFSKDKVKVSVYMSEYLTDGEGRIDITQIGSDSGDVLVENFGKCGFVDDVAVPEIEFETQMTDYNGIYAPLGYEYTLPKATVIGGDAKGNYSVSVYANYGSDIQLDVPIVNGKIKIEKNIQYSVLYTASNASGGKSHKVINVNAVPSAQKPITLNAGSLFTEVEAGETIEVPEFSFSSINRNDLVKVKIKAVHEKETLEIDATKMTFVPSYAGEYKLVYELSDNAFSIVEEFAFNCKPSENIAFAGKVTLPKYLIKDATYSFEKASAYSYKEGYPKAIEVKAYVSFDGNAFAEIADINKVKITGSSTAVIKYVCSSGSLSEEYVYPEIKIVDVNYSKTFDIKVKNYFIHDGFNVKDFDIDTNRSPDVKFESLVNSGNNSLEFINAIDISKLSLEFKIPKNNAEFNAVKVLLTDYYDSSKTISMEFTNGNPYCVTSINGQNTVRSVKNFADDNGTKKINYNSDLNKLTFNDETSHQIDLVSYFSSSLCYLTIELQGIYGNAALIVSALNGQPFVQDYSYNTDNVKPIISYKDFSGEYALGSVIKTSIPVVTDVLSPISISDVHFIVKKDDAYLVSNDGVTLDQTCNAFREYEITLNEQGKYLIAYSAVDGYGNTLSESCYVVVIDNTAPAIKFVKDYGDKVTISVNETLDVGVRVYDDYTADEEIVTNVLVQDLKSSAFYTYKDYKIKFGYVGEFEVYVTAKDKTGNFSSVKLKVTVKD